MNNIGKKSGAYGYVLLADGSFVFLKDDELELDIKIGDKKNSEVVLEVSSFVTISGEPFLVDEDIISIKKCMRKGIISRMEGNKITVYNNKILQYGGWK